MKVKELTRLLETFHPESEVKLVDHSSQADGMPLTPRRVQTAVHIEYTSSDCLLRAFEDFEDIKPAWKKKTFHYVLISD